MGITANGNTEPCDFGKTPCNQCSSGIVPETEPVTYPCSDGNDVFHRSAKLHSKKVITDIHAKKIPVKDLLQLFCIGHVAARDGNRGRKFPGHFTGKAWPGKTSKFRNAFRVQYIFGYLRHEHQRLIFYSFCGCHKRNIRRQIRSYTGYNLPENMGGNSKHHKFFFEKSLFKRRNGFQKRRQLHIRQENSVYPLFPDLLKNLLFSYPEIHLFSILCQEIPQCCPPAAGSDDSYP